MKLVVRPAAAADIDDAYLWYEPQRAGLGNEFLDGVADAFRLIIDMPEQYPVAYRETRRAHIRRFPYSVFYRILGEDIVVVACFHGSRDPRRWKVRR